VDINLPKGGQTKKLMTSFFEHQRTSYKRNYIRNLIVLASSDGNLDTDERSLIIKIGKKRGLKTWQVEELLNDKNDQQVFLPESLHNRMNMLFDLMQVIHADNKVTEKEIQFMISLVEAFRLKPDIVVQLMLLFESNTPSADEWLTFTDFVSANMVQK
jgi:uncharacterized tellurite resistance protein B-like protein